MVNKLIVEIRIKENQSYSFFSKQAMVHEFLS